MLLEAKDLVVHYGTVEALKGISFEVEEGNIVTIIGANGAGKTTTLMAISGLRKPTAGQILFRGKRIDGKAPQDITALGIAHVPEGRRVFATMAVLENLELGAYLRNDKRGVARDLESIYELFPILKKRRNQAAGSLSGGEQQMLAIARALMANPVLILMDEPTLGLSPLVTREVANTIIDIKRRGVSIVLIEQNARMALQLADMGYVLETGRVALQGIAKDLIDNKHVIESYLGG